MKPHVIIYKIITMDIGLDAGGVILIHDHAHTSEDIPLLEGVDRSSTTGWCTDSAESAAVSPPLVLPSLQELGLPPVATAQQVVEAAADIIRTDSTSCDIDILVGQVKYAFTKRGLCLTPPANWADIIRQAAPPHYEVLPSTDVHEVVTLRALCNAEPDATLVLEPCAKFPQLTVAEVIADVQDVLRRAQGLGRWGEDTPFWWHYAKLLPAVRRPPWEFCRDAVLAAAVPHWEASVCEAERRVAFHPREQPQ